MPRPVETFIRFQVLSYRCRVISLTLQIGKCVQTSRKADQVPGSVLQVQSLKCYLAGWSVCPDQWKRLSGSRYCPTGVEL